MKQLFFGLVFCLVCLQASKLQKKQASRFGLLKQIGTKRCNDTDCGGRCNNFCFKSCTRKTCGPCQCFNQGSTTTTQSTTTLTATTTVMPANEVFRAECLAFEAKLICLPDQTKAAHAFISLWDKDPGEDDSLGNTTSNADGTFEIEACGDDEEFANRIDPYLKVIHNCTDKQIEIKFTLEQTSNKRVWRFWKQNYTQQPIGGGFRNVSDTRVYYGNYYEKWRHFIFPLNRKCLPVTAATKADNNRNYIFHLDGLSTQKTLVYEYFHGRRSAAVKVSVIFPCGPDNVTAAVTNKQGLTMLFQGRMVYGYIWDSTKSQFHFDSLTDLPSSVTFVPTAAFSWNEDNTTIISDGRNFMRFIPLENASEVNQTLFRYMRRFFSTENLMTTAVMRRGRNQIYLFTRMREKIYDLKQKKFKRRRSTELIKKFKLC